ncbi:hypothetical protein FKM82_009004 [Ascaphus truei]
MKWHDRESSFCCNIGEINLDPEKCYLMQLKFKVRPQCEDFASEWGPTIFLKKGNVTDSCSDDSVPEEATSKRFKVLLSVILSLVIFVIVSFACIIKRVNKYVVPIIPDPKHIFSGLFDDYSGNFKEWLMISGNETKQDKTECLDKECIIEEQPEEEKKMQEKENETLLDIPRLDDEQISNVQNTSVSLVENGSVVCFGNFTFTMNDSMYIML